MTSRCDPVFDALVSAGPIVDNASTRFYYVGELEGEVCPGCGDRIPGDVDRCDDCTVPAHLSPRAGSGVRRAVRRVLRSPAAADLRASVRSAYGAAVICSLLIVGVLVGLLTRDVFLTPDGVIDLSTYRGNP